MRELFAQKGYGKDHSRRTIPAGSVFGYWTTLEDRSGPHIACRCKCGLTKCVLAASMLAGVSLGCRLCRRRDSGPGVRLLPEYKALKAAIRRCHDETNDDWDDYGGRGISVCDQWRESFDDFMSHIGPRPSSKHSLDRIDNDRGYEPGNVRWATWTEQRRNQRRYIRAHCIATHEEDSNG